MTGYFYIFLVSEVTERLSMTEPGQPVAMFPPFRSEIFWLALKIFCLFLFFLVFWNFQLFLNQSVERGLASSLIQPTTASLPSFEANKPKSKMIRNDWFFFWKIFKISFFFSCNNDDLRFAGSVSLLFSFCATPLCK